MTAERMPPDLIGTISESVQRGPAHPERSSRSSPARPRQHDAGALRRRFQEVRATTERLTEPLSAEDAAVQSMPDASPAKWHLGHTSWFFETFVLSALPGYQPHSKDYAYIFNSYYDALGARVPRHARGLLTRPSLAEVQEYRRRVTERVVSMLHALELPAGGAHDLSGEARQAALARVEIGLHHEQQHQELILTDIKHLLSNNPLFPAYLSAANGAPAFERAARPPRSLAFRDCRAGLVAIGSDDDGFSFDNEGPRHRVYLEPYQLGTRLVNNGEYLAFMRDGGYRRPELWLSDGFRWVTENRISAPLYWHEPNTERPQVFTLAGLVWLALDEPVCHVSYYEADAYARWAGARLPSEAEWERALVEARGPREPTKGGEALPSAQPPLWTDPGQKSFEPDDSNANWLETGQLHPRPPTHDQDSQMFGDVWEWTQSAYAPYPGYRPQPGALGEYNGKFMCNQMVLRGGSCATPRGHVRPTYRNFFPPDARWQFSGIRLAKDT
jgi:ergothioneine biosynthesis protein EgtB